MNTVNRRPSLVDTPTSKQIQTQYFHQNEWKGICEDKNTFGVDQNTFAECENVYVDRDNVLCNRPGLVLRNLPTNFAKADIRIQLYSTFSNVRVDWGNGDIIDYVASSSNYVEYDKLYRYKQSGKYFGKVILLPPSNIYYSYSRINDFFKYNTYLTKLVLGTSAFGPNGAADPSYIFLTGCSGLKELHIQKLGPNGLKDTCYPWLYEYGNPPKKCNLVLYDEVPPTLGNYALRDDATGFSQSIKKIYVPENSVNAYKTAVNWSNFANIIEANTNIALPLQEDTTFEVDIPIAFSELIKIINTKSYIIYAYSIDNATRIRVIDIDNYADIDIPFTSKIYAYELGNKLFIFTVTNLYYYENGSLIGANKYLYLTDEQDVKNLFIRNNYILSKTLKYNVDNETTWPVSGYDELYVIYNLDLLKINNVYWPGSKNDLIYAINAKTSVPFLNNIRPELFIRNKRPGYLYSYGSSDASNITISIVFYDFVLRTSTAIKTITLPHNLGAVPSNGRFGYCTWSKSQGKFYISTINSTWTNSTGKTFASFIEYDIKNNTEVHNTVTIDRTIELFNADYTNFNFIFSIQNSEVSVILPVLFHDVTDVNEQSYIYLNKSTSLISSFINNKMTLKDFVSAEYAIVDVSKIEFIYSDRLITISTSVRSLAELKSLSYEEYHTLRNKYFYDFNQEDNPAYKHSYQLKSVQVLDKVFEYYLQLNELFGHINDVYVDTSNYASTANKTYWFETENGIFTNQKVSSLDNDIYDSSTDVEYVCEYITNFSYTGEVPSLIRPIGSNSFLYFVNDTSYILQVRYNNETLQLYLPEGKENKYYDSIIDAEQTSDKSLVVIGNNVLYSVVDTGEVDNKQLPLLQYIQSKLNLRVIENSDSIIAYNSSTLLVPTYNGIAAVNYSQLISVEEQTVNYITDNIMTHWFNFVKSGTIKTCNHNYYLFVYNTNRNGLYMFDYRSNTWWYFTFKKKVKLMHTIGLYCFIVFEDNTLHYFDEKVLDAQWSITSQKLFLGNNTNYKQIKRFTVHTVGEHSSFPRLENADNIMDLRFYCYRKRMHSIQELEDRDDVYNFNVDFVRTYVIRLNYPKVYEFQYKLSSNKINLKPLALTGITIEYNVGGKVR